MEPTLNSPSWNSSQLKSLNDKLKNSKKAVVVLLLILTLPVLILLATNKSLQKFLLRIKAAPNAELSLVPQGVVRNAQNNWEFIRNQNVNVDVVVKTGPDSAVELTDVVVNYNPTVLSAQSITCNQSSTPPFYSLTTKYPAVTVNPTPPGEYRDPNGIIRNATTNAEIGRLDFSCVPFDPPFPTDSPAYNPNWQAPIMVPIQTNTTQTIATIVFTPLALSAGASLDIGFAAVGNNNDSNLLSPLSPPISTTPGVPGTDQLGTVVNAPFVVLDACPIKNQGDANCDNIVNIIDFNGWWLEATGQSTTTNADFTGDGIVNIIDFNRWWLTATSPTPSPT